MTSLPCLRMKTFNNVNLLPFLFKLVQTNVSSGLPSPPEMSSLFLFVVIANQLYPEEDPAPGSRIWQETADFSKDWKEVSSTATAVYSIWCDDLFQNDSSHCEKEVLRGISRRAGQVQDLWIRLNKKFVIPKNHMGLEIPDYLLPLLDPTSEIRKKLLI